MIPPSRRNLYRIMPFGDMPSFFPSDIYIQARNQSDLPVQTSKFMSDLL